VVEEALCAVGGCEFEPHRPRGGTTLRENMRLTDGIPLLKIVFSIYFELFNASTFFVGNLLVGAGDAMTRTWKCISMCGRFTRS
jgi:hypothetical protein